jgi:two-component system, cell cycle sensor histidine kinase and response regulator CckA
MQLEQSQYQDQLVRGLTHRMNNILTLFHGYVGLLLENDALDKATRESLHKIKDGATAASELMDRTHSLVRPTAVVWRLINLTEFVPMLRVVFDSFRNPKTKIEISCGEELPPVWADAGRIKTAIVELVRNACEATSHAGGVVRIEIRSEKSGSAAIPGGAMQSIKWISVAVIDNGPGIDPAVGEKIFQPFFSTKKRQSAAGLGLNVATGLVQSLGGLIRYESEPKRTCFRLLLPARSEI